MNDRAVTRTEYWKHVVAQEFEDFSATFYRNPPLATPPTQIPASNRLLVVGPCIDLNAIAAILEERSANFTEGRENSDGSRAHARMRPNAKHRDEVPVVYARIPENFWRNFFSSREFLDELAPTKPGMIISTGEMRDYDDKGAGMYIDVSARIAEIADQYQVPLIMLERVGQSFSLNRDKKRALKAALGLLPSPTVAGGKA